MRKVRAHQFAWWNGYDDFEKMSDDVNEFLLSFYEKGYHFIDVRFSQILDSNGTILHSAQVIFTMEVENA